MAKPLSPKQQRFVAEYLIDLNATQAAIRAGVELKREGIGFYVYFLVDGSTNAIFYVGKGKGRRMMQHRAEAGGANPTNYVKAKRIIDCGDDLVEVVFEDGLSEPDAMRIEKELIKRFRAHGLTNISSGSVHPVESQLARIEKNIAAILPYETWLARAHPWQIEAAARLKGSAREFYDSFAHEMSDLRLDALSRLNEIKENSNGAARG